MEAGSQNLQGPIQKTISALQSNLAIAVKNLEGVSQKEFSLTCHQVHSVEV